MTVDSFVDSVSGVGTLDGTGDGSFTVGTTRTADIIQATGAYSVPSRSRSSISQTRLVRR